MNAALYPAGHWLLGVHEHRHGESRYLFRVSAGSSFTLADFEQHLAEDFEPDRDEFLSLVRFEDDEVKVI